MPDVVIVGAGPTGCTVATTLARGGREVLLLDRQDPPIDSIGESLIPVCGEVFAELGVSMDGFQEKRGAVFTKGDDSIRFGFEEGLRDRHVLAWQTPRAELDTRMRKVALDAGAQLQVTQVRSVDVDAGVLQTDDGPVPFGFLVDAGGRSQFLARALGIRERHPWLKNAAMGAWHRGIRRQAEEAPGDVVIAMYEGGWFWFIPFADGTWSVGTTTTPDGPRGPDRWAEALERCPAAKRRLEGAERLHPFQGTHDISVSSSAFHGPNWALAGDAATFLDPVFSTGIALGLFSGRDLARALLEGTDLNRWERDVRAAVAAFEPIVKAYYDGTFASIAFGDRAKQQDTVRKAIVSLLAGDVFDPAFTGPKRLGARLDSIGRMMTSPA